MAMFESIATPSRAELEKAAIKFFSQLEAEVIDVPRRLELENFSDDRDFNLEMTRGRIAELDTQLVAGIFDGIVQHRAAELTASIDADILSLTASEQDLAYRLAARAEREQLAVLLHQITSPAKLYIRQDELFRRQPQTTEAVTLPESTVQWAISLGDLTARYLKEKKAAKGVGVQKIAESARPLIWLQDRMGADRQAKSITKEELRSFRTDLTKLSREWRGRLHKFDDRLTDVAANRIKSVTARAYWNSVGRLFRWAKAEGYIPTNEAEGLVIDKRMGEVRESPEPFSQTELRNLLKTTLYSGYRSPHRLGEPGSVRRRCAQWWSGVLMLHMGIRAGELAQLLPEDFDFVAPIPFIKIREENDAGEKVKSAKNVSSVRDVPIASILLQLGLAEFVQAQAKAQKNRRVFHAIRLGVHRASDGMTKFWSPYLRRFDLWKPGRATHVFRHTVVAQLRAGNVNNEDIAAIVGHGDGTMTASYGGPQSLERKIKTLDRLYYGFDMLSALGGPYDKKMHG